MELKFYPLWLMGAYTNFPLPHLGNVEEIDGRRESQWMSAGQERGCACKDHLLCMQIQSLGMFSIQVIAEDWHAKAVGMCTMYS